MAIDEITFRALNSLYLRKMGGVEAIAVCSGLDQQAVRPILARALTDDLVIDLGAEYVLSDNGRKVILVFYDETYDNLRKGSKVLDWYEQFEVLNSEFLKLISKWQASGMEKRTLSQLLRVVERHIAGLGRIEESIPRYRVYADRFTNAMELVDLGDTSFVTNPLADSIHNIWFEFHEDILAVIGRPRDTVDG